MQHAQNLWAGYWFESLTSVRTAQILLETFLEPKVLTGPVDDSTDRYASVDKGANPSDPRRDLSGLKKIKEPATGGAWEAKRLVDIGV